MAGAQVKISALPPDTSPTVTDSVATYDAETTLTKRVLLSDLITLFTNNLPTGAYSPVTRGAETIFDHVVQNTGVWSGDAYASTRLASMTAATVYINGRRISIGSVSSRTFTASKDVYVDVLDNLDGTGTLVYTDTTTNAASPALAANSIRIAIIVVGATSIAAAGSVNQGQETKVLPIASSIPYQVTDSLGNLICGRDPARKLLGYKELLVNFNTGSATPVQASLLSIPFLWPTGRKVKTSASCTGLYNTTLTNVAMSIWNGVVNSGTRLSMGYGISNAGGGSAPGYTERLLTPTTASNTYNVGLQTTSGTATMEGTSTNVIVFKVELD